MGQAVLTLSGTVTGIPSGQQSVNVIWSLPSAVGEVEPVSLGVGDNQINVPGGASTVLIQPPSSNSTPITLKQLNTDIGWSLHPNLPSYVSFGNTMTSFYLNVGSLLSGPVAISFL